MLNKLSMHSTRHKNSLYKGALLCALLITLLILPKPHITVSHKSNTLHTLYITFFFDIKSKDCLYKDFFHFSVDHPSVTLSQWKMSEQAVTLYDPLFKNHKQLFNSPCTLSIIATQQEGLDIPVHLYCTYFQKSEKKIKQIVTLLPFPQKSLQKSNAPVIKNTNAQLDQQKNSTYLDTLRTEYIMPLSNIIQTYKTKILQIPHALLILHCIIVIILISMIMVCFFMYQRHPIVFAEYMNISGNIVLYVCIYSILIRSISSITPLIHHMMHAIFLSGIGIIFTYKSTRLQSVLLQRICTIVGFAAIAAVVSVCFKTYQIMEFYL